MNRSPTRVQRVEIEWVDIEQDSGWGDCDEDLPICIQIGYIQSYPSKRHKIPFYKIKNAQCEEEPGGVTKIPKCNVVKIEFLGWATVPWRQ